MACSCRHCAHKPTTSTTQRRLVWVFPGAQRTYPRMSRRPGKCFVKRTLSAAFNTARLTRGCASGTSRGHWSRTHRCGPLRSAKAGMESLSCRRSVLCEEGMLMAAFGTLLFRFRNERGTGASSEQPGWQQPVLVTKLGWTMCLAYSRYTSCRDAWSETFDGRDLLLDGAQSSDARPQNVWSIHATETSM